MHKIDSIGAIMIPVVCSAGVSKALASFSSPIFRARYQHSVSAYVRVCLRTWRTAQKTNTSGMPPAEWGLRGWMCVYGRVLAGRGREPVQNNGTTVECGAAGNILSQTQGNPEVWGGALCGKTFINCAFILRPMTLSALFTCVADKHNMDACNQLFILHHN